MDELSFRANADVEDSREAGKDRKRHDRRADKKRDSSIRKVVQKVAPAGSKRRKAAVGLGVTAALAPAAYGTVRAVDAGTDAAARAAMVAGEALDLGESDNSGADYADGETTQGEVKAAQHEAETGRIGDAHDND